MLTSSTSPACRLSWGPLGKLKLSHVKPVFLVTLQENRGGSGQRPENASDKQGGKCGKGGRGDQIYLACVFGGFIAGHVNALLRKLT